MIFYVLKCWVVLISFVIEKKWNCLLKFVCVEWEWIWFDFYFFVINLWYDMIIIKFLLNFMKIKCNFLVGWSVDFMFMYYE